MNHRETGPTIATEGAPRRPDHVAQRRTTRRHEETAGRFASTAPRLQNTERRVARVEPTRLLATLPKEDGRSYEIVAIEKLHGPPWLCINYLRNGARVGSTYFATPADLAALKAAIVDYEVELAHWHYERTEHAPPPVDRRTSWRPEWRAKDGSTIK